MKEANRCSLGIERAQQCQQCVPLNVEMSGKLLWSVFGSSGLHGVPTGLEGKWEVQF